MKIDLVRRYLNGEKRADLCRETGVARSTMWGWVCTWDFVEIKRQCQEAIRSSIVEQMNETVRIFLYLGATDFRKGRQFTGLHILLVQSRRSRRGPKNRMFVSTNTRDLPSLPVTNFIYKCLNIILAGNPHLFGGSGKSCLRFSDGRSGGVADNNLTILILEEQDFITGF